VAPVYTGDSFAFTVPSALPSIQPLTPAFTGSSQCSGGHDICDFDISWSETAGQLTAVQITFDSFDDSIDLGLTRGQTASDNVLGGCVTSQCAVAGSGRATCYCQSRARRHCWPPAYSEPGSVGAAGPGGLVWRTCRKAAEAAKSLAAALPTAAGLEKFHAPFEASHLEARTAPSAFAIDAFESGGMRCAFPPYPVILCRAELTQKGPGG
jgi:hypothetical protein